MVGGTESNPTIPNVMSFAQKKVFTE